MCFMDSHVQRILDREAMLNMRIRALRGKLAVMRYSPGWWHSKQFWKLRSLVHKLERERDQGELRFK